MSDIYGTGAEVDIDCGFLGGRLAAFTSQNDINDLKITIPPGDYWLGAPIQIITC